VVKKKSNIQAGFAKVALATTAEFSMSNFQ